MKKILLLFVALTLAIILSACDLIGIFGSGNIVKKEYTFKDFTSVYAGYTCNVTITQGSKYSVSVSVDDNIIPYLDTYVSGGTLYVDLDSGTNYNNIQFRANIVMPNIKNLSLSGASSANVLGLDVTGNFRAVISDASDATVNLTSVGNLSCDVSGASTLNVSALSPSGTVVLTCSGASRIDTRNFITTSASVNISGASTVHLKSTGTISGSLSGASTLYYTGGTNANNVSVSGASSKHSF